MHAAICMAGFGTRQSGTRQSVMRIEHIELQTNTAELCAPLVGSWVCLPGINFVAGLVRGHVDVVHCCPALLHRPTCQPCGVDFCYHLVGLVFCRVRPIRCDKGLPHGHPGRPVAGLFWCLFFPGRVQGQLEAAWIAVDAGWLAGRQLCHIGPR